MLRRASAVVVLGLTMLSAVARADMPPPNDSPDAHCSLAQQCPHGVFCPYAFRPGATLPDGQVPTGQDCRADVASKGLVRRCRSGGNYSGEMLFCPEGETGSWTPPKDPLAAPTSDGSSTATGEAAKKKWSCTVSPGASPCVDGAAPLVSLALLLPVAIGRRSRRRPAPGR